MTHATGGGECGNCRCEHGYKHLYGLFLDDLPHFFTNSVENPHDFSVICYVNMQSYVKWSAASFLKRATRYFHRGAR